MTVSATPRQRWFVFGAALVGAAVAAGFGAAALRFVLDAATEILLGSVIHLEPVDDGLWHAPAGPLPNRSALLLPLLVAAGMFAATTLSRLGGPTVNGTDGVINAVNTRELSGLTARGAAAKLAGTAVTLGSGGSGGTEGPVVQVTASLGAAITRRLGLSRAQARVVVVAALSAGVGALFQVPIAGGVLGAELLRRRGGDWRLIGYTVPTALLGFGVFIGLYGYHPMFGVADLGALWDPVAAAVLALIGLGCAVLARLYVWTFHRVGRLLEPARKRPGITAAAAGAAVGTVGIFVPMALGTGYGVATLGLSPSSVAALPLWLLAVLPLVKIGATAVTLHAGGVGGVFGPAMVIGATAGALGWRLAVEAGVQPGPVAACTLAGLAACLGAAVRAPLAAIVFAGEVAGYLLPPPGLVVAVVIATVFTGGITVFPSQESDRTTRRSPQLVVSVMLKTVVSRKRTGTSRTAVGFQPRRRNLSDSSGEGCPMEPEATHGLPDLTDLPLEDLLGDSRPEVSRALHTALRRRAAVGIVFAGHSSGGAA
ncbi:chloride channel protein [Nocardia donostiensis]|uniref:Chloride channel protein n=1 Tax=Nocardia donostiensis TaxID=1538463 RepID=A0A1W0BK29_9NOCA|nr:chloride channel protein [Nocardia donostiensis]ONM48854.1 hypothetical protein B0T46_10270 [Nocardia donostiensis]OQS22890.1 hypothetical protein B0T44_04195 [Nocardia donostiensis]